MLFPQCWMPTLASTNPLLSDPVRSNYQVLSVQIQRGDRRSVFLLSSGRTGKEFISSPMPQEEQLNIKVYLQRRLKVAQRL